MLVLLALIGCQAPFGADRHDLTANRVAAISLEPAGGVAGTVFTPRLAMVTDGKPWSDALPPLSWSFVAEGDDDASERVEGAEAGTGPSPALVLGVDRRLVLVVDWAEGERRHVIDIPEQATRPELDPIGFQLVVDVSTSDLVDADLSPEIRRGWELVDSAAVGVDRIARMSASSSDPVRWMATSGDFLELESDVADWFPGSVRLDDGVVDEVSAGDAGVQTLIALAVGESVAWQSRDVRVGELPPMLETTSGRLLPTDLEVASGLVQGVLRADDDAPSGVRFEVLGPAEPTVDPGTGGLCSVVHAGPFDPDWLLDGTCTRADVVDATVVVEVR